jgi:hypothetical protein
VTVLTMSVLAAVLLDQEKGEEAEDLLRKVIDGGVARASAICERPGSGMNNSRDCPDAARRATRKPRSSCARSSPKRERQFGCRGGPRPGPRASTSPGASIADSSEEAAELLAAALAAECRSASASQPYFRELRETYAPTLLALERYDEAERSPARAHREALAAFGVATADSRTLRRPARLSLRRLAEEPEAREVAAGVATLELLGAGCRSQRRRGSHPGAAGNS